MTEQTKVYDVIIVGAGISGLSCGHKIQQGNDKLSVLVLDAMPRVGGRTYTIPTKKNEYLDLGGQWVGPTQYNILNLAKELNIDTFPQYDQGYKTMSCNGTVKQFHGFIPPQSYLSLIETQLMLWKIDRFAFTIPLDCPWKCPDAEQWDALSIQSWIDDQCWFDITKQTMELAISMIFGTQTRETSLFYFFFYVHAAGGIEQLLDVKGAAQDSKVVGGTQQFSNKLSEQVSSNNGVVQTDEPVICIKRLGDQVEVVTTKARYRSRSLVVAVPPTMTKQIEFQPSLPVSRDQLSDRVFMGCYTKVFALFETPFWRENGASGEAYSLTPTVDCPVEAIYDAVSPSGKQCALCCFLAGDFAIHFSTLNVQRQHEVIINSLLHFFNPDNCPKTKAIIETVQEIVIQEWSKEKYTKGCPVNIFPPGSFARFSAVLRRGQWDGLIQFASTETALQWTGYMDGAVEAGYRAAQAILKRLETTEYYKDDEEEGGLTTSGWVNCSGQGNITTIKRRNRYSFLGVFSVSVVGVSFLLGYYLKTRT